MKSIRGRIELAEFLAGNGLKLVKFYADWCPHCRNIASVVARLAEMSSKADIAEANVDSNPWAEEEYEFELIPTLIFFRGGQEISRLTGILSEEQILVEFEKNVAVLTQQDNQG